MSKLPFFERNPTDGIICVPRVKNLSSLIHLEFYIVTKETGPSLKPTVSPFVDCHFHNWNLGFLNMTSLMGHTTMMTSLMDADPHSPNLI